MEKKEVTLSSGKKLAIREPLVRDMRAVSNFTNLEEKTVRLVSNLTNLTLDELDALTFKDFSLLQAELEGFLS
jgi:hypothetical protein